jgi:hypothetical protein
MKKEELGIVILATNAYFILGVRFIRRFMHFYKGDMNVKFYFFSDTDPAKYLPLHANVEFHHTQHTNWVDGTNSKFRNINKLQYCSSDWLFYFDADTNIIKDFTEQWMIGENNEALGKVVSGEHYSARTTLKDGAGFDRNPKGNSYVPIDDPRPYTYRYGAFFGGEKDYMISMCTEIRVWQYDDQKIGYEPPVNDESYLNKYFHYRPNYTVPIEKFEFVVSDKGGLGNTRIMSLNIEELKKLVALNRDELWNIQNKKFIHEPTDMVGQGD